VSRGDARAPGPVHHVDFGGAGRPVVVLVHGLGGSHLNWELLAPRLTAQAHVLALDLPGFGLSPPAGRPSTVRGNVAVLAGFVREHAEPPVVLVGNSMGGLISILLAARVTDLVRGLVLLDPALPAPLRALRSPVSVTRMAAYAVPGLGELLRRDLRRRIGPRATLDATLRLCGVDPGDLPADLVRRAVALVERQSDVAGMDRAFLSASRSLAWTLARRGRYEAAMRSVSAPVLLLHGDHDRLVPVAAARAVAGRHPRWRYVELEGVGHLPQLQVPDQVAARLGAWLHGLPGTDDPLGQGPTMPADTGRMRRS
jgi:pimeloyl-ACP methyl ester carboxylesterase